MGALTFVGALNLSAEPVVLQLSKKWLPNSLVKAHMLKNWKHRFRVMNLKTVAFWKPANDMLIALWFSLVQHVVQSNRKLRGRKRWGRQRNLFFWWIVCSVLIHCINFSAMRPWITIYYGATSQFRLASVCEKKRLDREEDQIITELLTENDPFAFLKKCINW